MKISSNIYKEILKILEGKYNKSFTLEELTNIVMSTKNTFSQRESESKVLDALILLENEGLVVLNSDTDESSIAKKSLIKDI